MPETTIEARIVKNTDTDTIMFEIDNTTVFVSKQDNSALYNLLNKKLQGVTL